MQDESATEKLLASIDSKLSALVALTAHAVMRQDPTLPEPPHVAVSVMLAEAGLSNEDVGKVLGKSADAARKQIERDRKKAP